MTLMLHLHPLRTVLTLMCVCLPATAHTQTDSALHIGQQFTVGTTIRVTSPTLTPRRQVLQFQSLSKDALFTTGKNDQQIKIDRLLIHKLEYVDGKSRQWKSGAKWGAVAGFTLGAVYGAATGGVLNGIFGTKRNTGFESRAKVAMQYGIAGMFGGALYGVGIGSLIKKDRWVSIPPK